MDKNEFIAQVKEHIDKVYGEFIVYQNITWGILSYVNKLFRENGLTYYLAYGTLLGAVRDKGPIPWDYDVDIHIKVSDLDRLMQILKTKLSDDYYYVYTDNMVNYPAECLRICKKGYTYMSFHVDVFFLVGCPDDKAGRTQLLKMARKWSNFRAYKYSKDHIGICHSFSRLKNFLLSIYGLKYKLIPESYIIRREKKILYSHDISKCCLLMSYCFEANWGDKEYEVYPARIFDNTMDVEINGESYSIPSGYAEYLSLIFKNYTSYPSIEERFQEFYTQIGRIKERQEYYINNIIKNDS